MTSSRGAKVIRTSRRLHAGRHDRDHKRGPFCWIRIFGYLTLAMGAVAQIAPFRLTLITFGLVTLSLLHSIVFMRFITLGTMFEIGFLALVGTDIVTNFDDLQGFINLDFLSAGVSLHILAFATLMTVYYLHSTKLGKEESTPSVSATRSPSLIAVVAVYVATLLTLAPRASQRFALGRSGSGGSALSSDSALDALLGAAQHGLVVSLGALVTYTLMTRFKRGLVLSYAVCSPLLLMIFVIGTRYLLLYAVVPPVVIALALRPDTKRVASLGGIIAIVAVVASSAMRSFRTEGFANSRLAFDPIAVFGSEGLMKTSAQLVQYFENRSHLFGESTLSVLISPIPRSLWSDKPSLIGYWFPREIQSPKSFSDGHSVSFGIIGDAYADGGTLGVFLFSTLLGLLLSVANTFAHRALAAGGTNLLVASILYPTAFFAVRSPTTACLTLAAATVILLLATKPIKLLDPTKWPLRSDRRWGSSHRLSERGGGTRDTLRARRASQDGHYNNSSGSAGRFEPGT